MEQKEKKAHVLNTRVCFAGVRELAQAEGYTGLPTTPLNSISVAGWPSGHAQDCEEAIAFAQTHGIKTMVEKFPFANVAEGVQKMVDNKVRFRSVLVMDQ